MLRTHAGGHNANIYNPMKNVVTRIAPSPTGRMHIGTARTALFNYLWARHSGGKFIVRIEDTDPARDKPEYEKDILENLQWLGIQHDEFHRQSENKDKHTAAIKKLIDDNTAYVSREPAKDGSGREVGVVRFRNPARTVTFKDELRGEISVHSGDLGDFVIARSLTAPVHHLAVVVDDADEGVTLTMRGEDLLSNTPRQILIQEALGIEKPQYLHLPLILAPDRSKLSKRRHATSIGDFRAKGYLPQAMTNFLTFLGWNPGDEKEIFTLEELIAEFSIEKIQKNGAIFNEEKLNWMNREHLLKLSDFDFLHQTNSYLSEATRTALENRNLTEKIVPLMRERIQTFGELKKMDEEGEWEYFINTPAVDVALLTPKKASPNETKTRLETCLKLLTGIPNASWTTETIRNALWPYAETEGKGNVLWPVRFALSGKEKSPDPFTIAGIIGKDETEKRITAAINSLS